MPSFHFDLVSPERLLFSGAVEQVVVPGTEGEFGVLAGHAPFVSMLKIGVLSIMENGTTQRVVIDGGFAEVAADKLTVLTEFAQRVEDFDASQLAVQIKNTEEDVADASDDVQRDKLRQKLEHLRALQTALGAGSA